MKKLFKLVFAVALSIGMLTACSSNEVTVPEEEGSGIFGVSIMTLGAEFFTGLQSSMEKVFGNEGFEVVTVSAEMDVAKQVSDIENLVTQEAEGILVGPMDPNSLQDACIAAREAGTKIITFVPFEDTEAYDVLIGIDEYSLGSAGAELASEWVDKKFADAGNASVTTILITYPSNPNAVLRVDGLKTIANNTKVNIVENYELGAADPVERVQEFMEIALAEYPNLNLILVHDASFAIAANEVLARTSGVDASKVGIFAIGASEATVKAVADSKTDASMIRGLVALADIAESTLEAWNAIKDGTVPADKFIAGSYTKLNADSLD